MVDPFEDFSEEARRVITFARDESARFNHNYVGTEHLLLGLLIAQPTIASRALARLGVELNKVRSAVEFIIGRGDQFVLGEAGLTPRAKTVIELGRDEARRLNHDATGPEHLLLGLVREGEGIAAGVLESLGVTLEKMREAVIHEIKRPNEPLSSASLPLYTARFPERHARWRPYARFAAVLTLVCRDVDATVDYYIEYLGATALDSLAANSYDVVGAERLIRLEDGGLVVALRGARPDEAEDRRGGLGAVELSFLVEDPVTLWARLQARDTPGLSALDEAPGARKFTVTDPDGRVLRFLGSA